MKKSNTAFSLIELSIVLVIVGLLIAALDIGSKMVKQAEIRKIISELEEIKIAVDTFRSAYSGLPGDLPDASNYMPGCASGGVGNVNCNGNGDGLVTNNMGNTYDGDQLGDEPSKVFRHLRLAEIYDGGGSDTLSDFFTPLGNYAAEGIHANSQAVTRAYYVVVSVDGGNTASSGLLPGEIYNDGINSLSPNFPQGSLGVYMMGDGMNSGVGSGGRGRIDAFTAHQIDIKMDDGGTTTTAATGANGGLFRVTNDLSAANPCVTAGNYNLDEDATTCIPGFRLD